jgi:hypothetical protein
MKGATNNPTRFMKRFKRWTLDDFQKRCLDAMQRQQCFEVALIDSVFQVPVVVESPKKQL